VGVLFLSKILTNAVYLVGYLLLGMISSLVFRAVRDALPNDPVAQERIVGATLAALAIADVRFSVQILICSILTLDTFIDHPVGSLCVPSFQANQHIIFSIVATVAGLPPHLRYYPTAWNGMTHGNITIVIFLFAVRYSFA
jgi:hypothetical protein